MTVLPQLETVPTILDVLSIGEVGIDLITTTPVEHLGRATGFEPHIGGQAANVAMNVARLGGRAGLVTGVGRDGFGRAIREHLEGLGVSTRGVIECDEPTTLIAVARTTGTPEFVVFRGADLLLEPDDEHLSSARVVHSSAFAISREPARSAIVSALKRARDFDTKVSFDPNFHPSVWEDDAPRVLEILGDLYPHVDVTKPSLDDATRIFGAGLEPIEYVERFLSLGACLVVLTMGARGVFVADQSGVTTRLEIPEIENVADATGAGDSLWAGLLLSLLDGFDPVTAAQVGIEVAQQKLQRVGPLPCGLDRTIFQAKARAAIERNGISTNHQPWPSVTPSTVRS